MARMLSEVLRGDKYTQGKGSLYSLDTFIEQDNREQKNCCLGVMECEIGIKFTYNPTKMSWVDMFGETGLPGAAVSRLSGLGQPVSEQDLEWLLRNDHDTWDIDLHACDRKEALAFYNDNGWDFSDIADILEGVGWDIDLDELKIKLDAAIKEGSI